MKLAVRVTGGAWIVLAFVLAFTNNGYAHTHSVLMRVTPTQGAGISPAPLRDTCLNPAAWPTGWERMDLFSNAQNFFDQISSAERMQCFSNLRGSGKLLGFGVGALKEWCTTAQACWDAVSGRLTTYRDEGRRSTSSSSTSH